MVTCNPLELMQRALSSQRIFDLLRLTPEDSLELSQHRLRKLAFESSEWILRLNTADLAFAEQCFAQVLRMCRNSNHGSG